MAWSHIACRKNSIYKSELKKFLFNKKYSEVSYFDNTNLGQITYRFNHDIINMGHKYRSIAKVKYRIGVEDSHLSLELQVIASPIIADGENLTPDEKINFDRTYVFEIPLERIPELLDMNQEEIDNFDCITNRRRE